MKIGQRNCLILKEIVNHSASVTGKDLEAKLNLSRKQLEYGIARINEYLEEQQLPILERVNNGRILIPNEVIEQLDFNRLEQENQDVWLSKEEREDIIQLMLLTKQQELSLQHFIAELKASKNTVLADLKRLKDEMPDSSLQLTYSREKGYRLEGSEYDLRQRLFLILRNILSGRGRQAMVFRIGKITAKQVEQMRNMTETIEGELKTRFTDEMFEVNRCFFILVLRRIRDGLVLDTVPETFRHMAGTKEYMVIKSCLSAEGVNSIYETMYFTAHIQSMRINSHLEAVAGQEEVYHAVEETISNFERIACICFENKDDTFHLLMNHSLPALYRIRYNFHIGPDISEYVLPAYQEVHDMVKKSVAPLEKLIGMSFPESELVYITLIFIAQTSREDEEEKTDRRPRAVVVCQNGVTVSHFLLTSLKRTFPEIDFLNYMSARQFDHYGEEFDLVFTTAPLITSKKQFVIEPLMDKERRKKLRKNVFESLKNSGEIFPQVETILQIIKKHTNESVFQKLRMEIDSYMVQSDQGAGGKIEKQKPELKELLTNSNIRIIKESMGWKEAIEFAAVPLLYKNIIKYQYVETIISNIIKYRQIMLIAEHVMIAHAGIDAGVYDVGFSMLLLPQTIMVNDYMEVKVIFVLVTPDYESHLAALNQLINILEDEKKLTAMKEAKTADEILELL
ncbi:MAG: BglG family transcription antiterminator [Hungatella sp.]|jgi:transcriptional antiterminator/mannitol/fructose-specific phosphotransferase system IIA component (Ntr-type)|nr:BglG family transcription antiterminator [Hungatella sp.]